MEDWESFLEMGVILSAATFSNPTLDMPISWSEDTIQGEFIYLLFYMFMMTIGAVSQGQLYNKI